MQLSSLRYRISHFLIVCIIFGFGTTSCAQTKKGTPSEQLISLRDIWGSGKFFQNYIGDINWMNDGKFYTALKKGTITKYDITTGEEAGVILRTMEINPDTSKPFYVSSYHFNGDESKLLLAVNETSIYRHSSKADFYIYDLATKKLQRLSENGKQMYATFSPDSKKVAFVRENNLFFTHLGNMSEKQITFDGEWGKIINGNPDWVYEEEFSFAKAFFWSPDSRSIAFYRFDESQVKEYNMQEWKNGLYPEDYRFKYPKAGEKNSDVKILSYDLQKDTTLVVVDETGTDHYIPRIQWTQNPQVLSVRRLNRLQNKLEIIHVNTNDGQQNIVYTEENDTYVEVNDDLTYPENSDFFIMSSEKSGYNHLYAYDLSGKLIRQITNGDWEVSRFYGYDAKTQQLYFSSTEVSPLERHIYSVGIDGGNKQQLVTSSGTNGANFSSDFSYYIVYNSTINTPLNIKLYEGKSNRLVRVLEDNADLRQYTQENGLKAEFFDFTTTGGTTLNGWMIKPKALQSAKKYKKKYPVLMYVYGGPGHQTVRDTWMSVNFFWFQMLAEQGYIVVSIDNRGTGGRGAEFKKSTYGQLGKLETIDQIEGAKYLATLPFVDQDRIGIWGWSYGGYMSSLCITKGADIFKAAIAVAPVTNWKYYDTIYTERYLKRPQDNEEGYEDNSPVNFAKQLKGSYLLIHGTGDDNVHVQNAIAMQNALIKANKQFQSFMYPDRNHGIYGGSTRYHLYKMMTDFITNKL